jgi:hypothetical protein
VSEQRSYWSGLFELNLTCSKGSQGPWQSSADTIRWAFAAFCCNMLAAWNWRRLMECLQIRSLKA